MREDSATVLAHTATHRTFAGVWLSADPLEAGQGGVCSGDDTVLLEVDIDLSESDLSRYEWVEEGKKYREFLIPDSIVNSRSRTRISDNECGPPLPLPRNTRSKPKVKSSLKTLSSRWWAVAIPVTVARYPRKYLGVKPWALIKIPALSRQFVPSGCYCSASRLTCPCFS